MTRLFSIAADFSYEYFIGDTLMRGVFLDQATVGEVNLCSLEEVLADWQMYSSTSAAELAARIKGVEVVVTNKVKFPAEVLQQANELKLICITATGYDNVDTVVAAKNGIAVCNVAGYSTASVAEHVFLSALVSMKSFNAYYQAVQQGQWQKSHIMSLLNYPIYELDGKTLGIIGYGDIGKKVAEIAKTFGMEILIAGHRDKPIQHGRVELHLLLMEADIVTIHCPLNNETRGMIGAEELAAMKKSAFLINTARGGIVSEKALAMAIENQQIAGAVVDVLSTEPPTDGNVLLDVAKEHPNLIITPHIAWASQGARQRAINETALNITAFLQGDSRNRVDD